MPSTSFPKVLKLVHDSEGKGGPRNRERGVPFRGRNHQEGVGEQGV